MSFFRHRMFHVVKTNINLIISYSKPALARSACHNIMSYRINQLHVMSPSQTTHFQGRTSVSVSNMDHPHVIDHHQSPPVLSHHPIRFIAHPLTTLCCLLDVIRSISYRFNQPASHCVSTYSLMSTNSIMSPDVTQQLVARRQSFPAS